jgi:hypothetical protein
MSSFCDLYQQYEKAKNYLFGSGVNKDIHTGLQLLRKVKEEASWDLTSDALKTIFRVPLHGPCVDTDEYNTPPHFWMDDK